MSSPARAPRTDPHAALCEQALVVSRSILMALPPERRGSDPKALSADLIAPLMHGVFARYAEAHGLVPPAPTRAPSPLDQLPYKDLAIEQLVRIYEALMDFKGRRGRGAHYTPRALTQPIVETTLRPIFERLGPEATPEQLLDLKICDPAMGAGAFLLEACQQLADRLVAAWQRAGEAPAGVEPVLHARRLVAERCIYGVDEDPLAVELGRLSLQLVARAQDRPRTFVDHALRAGDSLLAEGLAGGSPLRWELAFPEVFGRENGGFDAIVGNPPFAGRNTLFATRGERYVYALIDAYPGAHGSSDLAAYFFRRAFSLLRQGGALGFIATNTIAQGDTRATGLRWICDHGGTIFEARRRLPWPGQAAVVASVIHIARGAAPRPVVLDGAPVERITAFLFHRGGNADPVRLPDNARRSFLGAKIYGQGFLFDDGDPASSPLSELARVVQRDARNAERIFPYLGGEELNTSPTQSHHRFVINLNDLPEADARAWPELLKIARAKVRPERERLGNNGDARRRRATWWRWGQSSRSMFDALRGRGRFLAIARVSRSFAFTFLPHELVCSEQVVVFALSSNAAFTVLQSRIHEAWARLFGSSMKDDLRYTPSDCFETFPFPPGVLAEGSPPSALEAIGGRYHEARAALLLGRGEGLTQAYNRFHAPAERARDVEELRELHAAMDRAVLDAYGFTSVRPAYAFRPQVDGRVRLAWADETRDEVLARLLELNQAGTR